MTAPIDSLIYTRSEGLAAAMRYIDDNREMVKRGYGLHFPIREIAESYPVPPLLPPKVCTIQAQSHHGKSMFLAYWKDDQAERLNVNPDKSNIIISVSVEDMVEEEMAVLLLREAAKGNTAINTEKLGDLMLVSTQLGAVPVYHIGKSIERARDNVPPMNMTNIGKAIFRIIEKRKDKGLSTRVQAVFFDYLNATENDEELLAGVVDRKRDLQVKADFFYLRDKLAPAIPAPFVVAVQSKQKLEGTLGPNMRLPGLYDMQETSKIPQHTDSDFSLWMPKRDLPYGEIAEHGKEKPLRYAVWDDLTWLRCNKQRGYDLTTLRRLPGDKYWPLQVNFETGRYTLWSAEGTLSRLYDKGRR